MHSKMGHTEGTDTQLRPVNHCSSRQCTLLTCGFTSSYARSNGESPQPDVPRKTLPDGASHAPHTKLSGRLRRRTALITTCRHPQRVITEVGNQVQPATERFDVTCDDIESGALAVLDLGHASDAHTHTGSHIPLGQPVLLARLGELMTTGFRQQST